MLQCCNVATLAVACCILPGAVPASDRVVVLRERLRRVCKRTRRRRGITAAAARRRRAGIPSARAHARCKRWAACGRAAIGPAAPSIHPSIGAGWMRTRSARSRTRARTRRGRRVLGGLDPLRARRERRRLHRQGRKPRRRTRCASARERTCASPARPSAARRPLAVWHSSQTSKPTPSAANKQTSKQTGDKWEPSKTCRRSELRWWYPRGTRGVLEGY